MNYDLFRFPGMWNWFSGEAISLVLPVFHTMQVNLSSLLLFFKSQNREKQRASCTLADLQGAATHYKNAILTLANEKGGGGAGGEREEEEVELCSCIETEGYCAILQTATRWQ